MAALVDLTEFQNRALSNYGSGDRCHLGHILLQSLADHPDVVNQIDAATGQQETNAAVLRRSVRLARAMRARGLRPGDVLALAGPNHLDLCVPYYAAHYNGLPVLGIDPLFKYACANVSRNFVNEVSGHFASFRLDWTEPIAEKDAELLSVKQPVTV
ncbi:hypothetical protein EVAR_76993_1 [Eumeta japonica]|uniref:AMP-dependent synthetase/ligase domain-containing protein n=1 Tax=Eumeta variegata TaxID=151549 RepID=A0A4C1SFW7_EUMVA|nr:hypothetical protein EVAR_76993_1 [Eumeta japonica]